MLMNELAPSTEATINPAYLGDVQQDDRYGFSWAKYSDPNFDEQESNAVVLWINQGGRSEAVRIVGDVTLHVDVVSGRGQLVRFSDDMPEGETVTLEKGVSFTLHTGDSYLYIGHNFGDEGPLTLLDRSYPPFQDDDEISAEDK